MPLMPKGKSLEKRILWVRESKALGTSRNKRVGIKRGLEQRKDSPIKLRKHAQLNDFSENQTENREENL